MEEKEVIFDIDLIHLSMDIEDWFFTLPVRFCPNEYQQLRDARDKWEQTEEWINRDSDMDEEYFLLKYCPNILDKVRASLKEYCIEHFSEDVINELDQANIYMNL